MGLITNVLIVGSAGALGVLSRWGLCTLASRWLPSGFPFPTLIVNLFGCLLFGLAVGCLERFIPASPLAAVQPSVRLFALTGFLGAFTTFSTFAFDTLSLIEQSKFTLAMINLTVQNGLGIVAASVGLWLVGSE